MRLFQKASIRAEKRGLPVSITRKWIEGRLTAGLCEVTGIRLVLDGPARHPLAPTLDRRDPRRGYTHKNTRVVAMHVNLALSAYGEEEMAGLCVAFLGYYARTRGRAACWGGARAA